MPDYRIHVVGSDGDFIASEDIYCADDQEAVRKAAQAALANSVELWNEGRCVARLLPAPTAFRENEIDETVLPSLTHENLKELGVTALGHRLKLLDAIAALRNDGSGKAPSVDAATTSSAPSAHPEDRAERRQVTVMF